MKYLISVFSATLLLLSATACKKQEEFSGCLQEKFEEFKELSYAHSIVEIKRPDGPLYWFVDAHVDGGESVLNQDCELVCTADCECDGNVVFCDKTHTDFPQKVIWKK